MDHFKSKDIIKGDDEDAPQSVIITIRGDHS